MTLLSLETLTVRLGRRIAVDAVSLRVEAGELVGLVGPNGAGKSSLMRGALGLARAEGRSSLTALPAAERARAAAWLPQSREIAWPVSVETLVALGRLPHRAPGAPLSAADREALEAAMAGVDVLRFRDRPATELSGGEQARVLIARALAQAAPLTLADEPTAGLDPAHQLAAMEAFAALAGEGRAAVVSLHDLGLAARFCTRLVMLDQGRVVADGPPAQVLTAERLREVYGIESFLAQADGVLIVQPLARSR
ncbi:ABC transporter ATP-binding protein [uncultured Albimonas sp.]|uniref:ABC transporter ATP-binding protein n=1 Tax=uncultured Albimonas sp. TaxID=1331701 RepID=UPI0030EC0CF4|tara:strand:+ start:342 stop:1100 length:759 start_codon:yes stop_codon:yes gene_type:complete